jgi:ABC-type Mn2+/Zn2+ transport system permease subunit
MLRAYLAVLLMGAVSGAGALAIIRGIAYLPAEASHAALSGAAIGVLLSYLLQTPLDPFLAAVLVSIATTMIVAYAGRHGGAEALSAALAGALALSLSVYVVARALVPPELKVVIDSYLVGDILLLTWGDLASLAAVVVLGVFSLLLFYNEFIYVAFDPEGAEVMGLNMKFYDYLIFLLIGLAGGVAAKTVGSLLVFALILAPAVTAREFSSHPKALFIYTFIITVIVGYGGLVLGIYVGFPAAGTMALLASGLYAATLLDRSIRGLSR